MDMVPDINCKGEAAPSVQVPLKVVPERVGASLVAVMLMVAVAVVDSAVANHLVKITKAAKLMGCEAMISGLSPAVAQTMVTLGLDVDRIHTTNTLQDALEKALAKTGVQVST